MLIGTILVEVLRDAMNLVSAFIDSWLGTAVIATVAITLDLVAGAIKAVLIAIEKLLPLIEVLAAVFASLALAKVVSDFNNVWSAISAGASPINAMSTLGGRLASNLGLVKANCILAKNSLVTFVKDGVKAAVTACGNFFKALQNVTKEIIKFIAKLAVNSIKAFGNALAHPVQTLKNMGTALKANITALGTWIKTMAVSAFNAIKSFASACITGIANLLGLTAAEGSATVGATALSLALDLLGIGLIIAAIVGLIAVVKAIAKHFDEWKEKINGMLDKMGWFGDLIQWVCGKIGDLWNGIKSFFGWGGDNKPAEEMDDLTQSTYEAEEQITSTADAFGTASSTINQHLDSIHFPASRLAEEMNEHQSTMEEQFSMMSKTTQDYFDALVSGDKEALANWEGDTNAAMEELKYMYAGLNEEEQRQFFATYGVVTGINDDWVNHTADSYEELVADHVAYSQSILNNENLSKQEKDRLIEENYQKVVEYFDKELEEAKRVRDEKLSQAGLSAEDRYRIEYEYNQSVREIEDEKNKFTLDGIDSVEEAQTKANEAMAKSAEDNSKAQTEALKEVDTALETTSGNLDQFVTKSQETATGVTQAWEGVSIGIGDIFTSLYENISNAFNTILEQSTTTAQLVVESWSTISTDIANKFSNLSTEVNKHFDSVKKASSNAAKEIPKQWDGISKSVIKEFTNIKTNAESSMKATLSSVSNTVKQITSNMTSQFSNLKNTVSNLFNSMGKQITSSMTSASNSIKSAITQMGNNIKATFESVKSNVMSCLNNIRSQTDSTLNSMNSIVSSKTNNIKSSFSNGFSGIENIVRNALNNASSVLGSKMGELESKVRDGVSRIQRAWSNLSFSTKTPYLKMPHISAYGSFDMSKKPPTVPHFSVKS